MTSGAEMRGDSLYSGATYKGSSMTVRNENLGGRGTADHYKWELERERERERDRDRDFGRRITNDNDSYYYRRYDAIGTTSNLRSS